MSEDVKTRAETLKTEGNAALQNFKFATAIELYTAAIELLPTAIYYANRAAAHMRTESYGLAIEDASSAITIDPNYIKGVKLGDSSIALDCVPSGHSLRAATNGYADCLT